VARKRNEDAQTDGPRIVNALLEPAAIDALPEVIAEWEKTEAEIRKIKASSASQIAKVKIRQKDAIERARDVGVPAKPLRSYLKAREKHADLVKLRAELEPDELKQFEFIFGTMSDLEEKGSFPEPGAPAEEYKDLRGILDKDDEPKSEPAAAPDAGEGEEIVPEEDEESDEGDGEPWPDDEAVKGDG
jgi:hypothetical protein